VLGCRLGPAGRKALGDAGLAVFAELLLLPVAWYLTLGSHRALFGVPGRLQLGV